MAKDHRAFIAHALDCAQAIADFTRNGRESFLEDRKTRDAVLRNLEVLGQCIKDSDLAILMQDAPEVPWTKVAAFRNVLAHEYLGVDPLLVWAIIENHLPALESALSAHLKKLSTT